ncbi:uncharacterized protein LOC106662422 isoform X2 [Cimex lectularius]|uniref:Uncharacterized protein n=1 Tax=Cimex lectularius TaxID=79782 RepID=A0A8I6RBB2_CIMLE|nr:uncharacterized protein LOC106662422 isoform X2 [Cimex lectularius]XP_014241995.1 uncharacterized protein LOC106662422 isoform X2 [Cimex lectularius]
MGRRQEKGNRNERGQMDVTSESDTSYANRKRRYVKNKHSTICTLIPTPRGPRKTEMCSKHKRNAKNSTNNTTYRPKDSYEDESLYENHESPKGKSQSCHQCTKSKFSSKGRTHKQFDNYDNSEISREDLESNEESFDHLNDCDKGKSLLKKYGNVFDKCIAEEFEELVKCEKCKEETQRKNDSKMYLKNTRATQANKLTKEQLKLIAMDKPPLDKLSEIPLKYLKPRPPSHYRQNEKPKSVLAKNCFPEANFEQFVQSITERAHSVQNKGESIMEDDWFEPGLASVKKKSEPQPYLHPNVEKLFSKDTTKKVLNTLDEKSVSTQTDIKWENILQSTLFYEMDLERKAPFVFDLHKLQNDNWREALAQQEVPDRVPVNPLLSYNLKRKGLHDICLCCSGVPLEKHHVSDKCINTDPLTEKRVTFGKCTVMNTFTNESDDTDEHAEPSTQFVNKATEQTDTLDKKQNLGKGGGDTLCQNSNLNKQTPSPSKSDKDIYESALKGELKQGDYLTCLKIIDNITCAMLELDFNDSLKLAAGGDHLKQMQKLREDHLKHIQKEVHHLEELDKFLKKFSTQDSDS